jgi:pyruvate dehydrogenase E2 component (dihydrolipoamide acetyltransferase)
MDDQLAPADPAPANTGTGKGEARVEEPTRAQQSLARRTAESRATVPDLELGAEIDMSACVALQQPIPGLVVRACALALRQVPRANASYRDGRYELYSRVNVGVALLGLESYLVPTVFDADHKSGARINAELDRLAARAQAGELTPPELSGATFTLFNFGDLGVASGSPVIAAPQAAALSAGAVREAPILRDGAIVPGHVMTTILACDHRILYGAHAAAFLNAFHTLLERPDAL